MAKLLIIADDLTGAMDSGVQLAKQGVSTVVVPRPENMDRQWDCETMVVNTDTRHAHHEAASEAVRLAVANGRKHGARCFYKKVDSTLRGNIGSELEALLRASGEQRLVFVPAFPRQGRTTRGGRQYAHGVELQHTEYAGDPLNPIRTSDVGERIREQSTLPVHNITAAELASAGLNARDGIYVVDCTSDRGLQQICKALRARSWRTALAGSAGFAECLADLLELATGPPPDTRFEWPWRMLVVNGSLNPAAARQILRAQECGFEIVRIEPELLADTALSTKWDGIVAKVQARMHGHVILTTTAPAAPPSYAASWNMADKLGQLAARVIGQAGFAVLMVIGGDTLAGVTRALQCRSIIPLTEMLPGVALSKCTGQSGEIFLISKAGGFCSDDVLPVICEWLRRVPK
jgi:uncharacterized protein YgbK (DUF1537 family)